MIRYRSYLLLLLVLLLLLILVVLFRSFVMQLLVRPLSLFLWAFWRALLSLDQKVYWTLLVAAALLLGLRLLPAGAPPLAPTAYHYKQPDRITYWRELALAKGDREALRKGVRSLLLSALAQTERADPEDLEVLARSGAIPVPPAVRDFLLDFGTPAEESVWKKALLWINDRFGYTRRRERALVSEVLAWMESRMEIPHD